MAIESNPFGGVTLTGEDAAEFRRQMAAVDAECDALTDPKDTTMTMTEIDAEIAELKAPFNHELVFYTAEQVFPLIDKLRARVAETRALVAELYCASGCSCCRDDGKWYAASDALAVLLDAPRYEDDSGVDWRSIRDAARTALNGGNDG